MSANTPEEESRPGGERAGSDPEELEIENHWKNLFPRAIRRAGRSGVSLMKRTR